MIDGVRVEQRRVQAVQRSVFRWFARNQRDLPWRHTKDPYKILVSEVMLQQTQVDRVIPKYRAFLRTFPIVRALARATPRDVLLAWAGMGYNRRALYLWRAAREIVTRFDGRVPTNPQDLVSLPGIGSYTAAAVATFSTGVPHALADTNVRRVVSRVFLGLAQGSPAESSLLRVIESTTPRTPVGSMHHALWGHALMDFGALVCRAKPRCAVCPLQRWCRAYPAIQRASVRASACVSMMRVHASTLSRLHTRPPVPDRLVRGKILALVRLFDPRPVSLSALRPLLAGRPGGELRRLLRGLVADGLLEPVSRGSVRLPRGGDLTGEL